VDAPIFDLILNDKVQGQGMKFTSLVGKPAILVEWMKFSSDHVQLSIQDAEQRIVFGPALIPGLPIKRTKLTGEEFFVRIDDENILKTAIKFHSDGIANNVDANHSRQLIPGVTIFETIVTNPNRVPSVKGYEGLPIGTLFFSAKVNDDQTWADIQSGKYKGFSIDALFELDPVETLDSKTIQREITEILSNR
jgi:hypothetical protein